MLCRCRGTIEIRTRSRCFADIFRATRTGADVGFSRRGRNRTYLIRFVGAAHLPVCHSTCLLLFTFCSGNARNRTACRHRTIKATGLQPAVRKHSHQRKARDSNPERFHPQLHSKQCPHPAGYLPLGWSTGIEPASTWVTTKSLNQHSTTTAPGTGIEPATFWFRARRDYQQLLPRINKTPRQRIER